MKRLMLMALTALAAFGGFGATYNYYLNPTVAYGEDPFPQPLTEGTYWTKARDGSGEKGAAGALKSSSTYHYYMGCGTEFTAANTVHVTGEASLSCSGYILHLGDESVTPWTPAAIVQDFGKKSLSLTETKTTYLSKGLILYKTPFATTTKLTTGTVYAPKAEPFQIAFATNNCAVTWSGTTKTAKASEDYGLLIGGSSALCPDTSTLTNNTIYMSGTTTGFYGTITVTNENRTIPSFLARPMTFKLKSTGGIPGTVRMCDYTAYTLYATNSVNTIKNMELGNNVLLTFPFSKATCSRLNVTNSFAIADGAKVQVYLAPAVTAPQTGTRKLTLITAPDTADFTVDDFELVGHDANEIYELKVETDDAKHTKALVCNFTFAPEGSVFAKKGDSNSYKNNAATYYTTMITNPAAWSDGKPVSAEKDYILRAYATTVYTMRTPQPAWRDGAGNTGDDFSFPGKSLTIGSGCWLMPIGKKTTFGDLTLMGGSILATPSVSATELEIAGNVKVPSGTVSVRPYASKPYVLSANVSGAGELLFDGWLGGKNVFKYTLAGDNSAFAGTMRIEVNDASDVLSSDYYSWVIADDAARFGAALDAYDPAALVLAKRGKLELTKAVRLAHNRGVTVTGAGTIVAGAGASFAADGLTLDGALTLDGVVSFDAVTAKEGASVVLQDATLTVGNADAFAHVPLAVTGKATLMAVSAKPEADGRGLDLSGLETPFTVAAGGSLGLYVIVADASEAGEVFTNAVVTVKAAQAGTVRALIGEAALRGSPVSGFSVSEIVETENADGSVTFKDVLVRGTTEAHVGSLFYGTVDRAAAVAKDTGAVIVLDTDATPEALADGTYVFDANGHELNLAAFENFSRFHTEGGLAIWEVCASKGDFVFQVGETAEPGNINKYWQPQEAVTATPDGGLVKVLCDATVNGFQFAQSKFPNGVTLDLCGHTLTFNSPYVMDNYYAIRLLKGNAVTIRNGKLTTTKVIPEAKYDLVNIIRNFTEKLDLVDVELDGTTLDYISDEESRTTVYTLNGEVRFLGTTSIDSPEGCRSFVAADHSGNYSLKTNTFNTTGAIKGDMLICGGKLYLTNGQFDPNNHYYFGAGKNDNFTDDDTDTFEARIGELIPPTGTTDVAVGGEFFYTFDQAFRTVTNMEVKTIATLKDIRLAAADAADAEAKRYVYEGADDIVIDTNGHVFDTAADVAFVNAGTGKMTFRGDGTVVTTNSPAAVNTCLWAKNGAIDVSGGTFVNKSETGAVIRAGDADPQAPQGGFVLTGGRFRNLAADDCDVDTYLADGYVSFKDEDGYRAVGGKIAFVADGDVKIFVEGVEVSEVKGLVGKEISFVLASDLRMPIYYIDGAKTVAGGHAAVIPGGTTNIAVAVKDAATDEAATDDDRAAAIIESIDPGEGHDAAVAKVTAILGANNENAKRVGAWLGATGVGSAALAASQMVNASFNLGTALLDGATVTVTDFAETETPGTFALTFEIKAGDDPVAVAADAAAYAKTLVRCAGDVGFKATLEPTLDATVDEGRVNVTVTPPANESAAFMKVVIPED